MAAWILVSYGGILLYGILQDCIETSLIHKKSSDWCLAARLLCPGESTRCRSTAAFYRATGKQVMILSFLIEAKKRCKSCSLSCRITTWQKNTCKSLPKNNNTTILFCYRNVWRIIPTIITRVLPFCSILYIGALSSCAIHKWNQWWNYFNKILYLSNVSSYIVSLIVRFSLIFPVDYNCVSFNIIPNHPA